MKNVSQIKKEEIHFNPFGNLGFQVSENLKQFCHSKLNFAVMAYVGLRCLEYQNDLFVLLVPEDDCLHIGILNSDYQDVEEVHIKGVRHIGKDVNLFYSKQKFMFVSEIPM
ncbi:hypothetical protein [Flagellimonas sp. C4]|uniref:hypothetical protein n=1 Tax=Flagellimonas alginolytica TaxID=3177515 RepID=UPI0035C88FB4